MFPERPLRTLQTIVNLLLCYLDVIVPSMTLSLFYRAGGRALTSFLLSTLLVLCLVFVSSLSLLNELLLPVPLVLLVMALWSWGVCVCCACYMCVLGVTVNTLSFVGWPFGNYCCICRTVPDNKQTSDCDGGTPNKT